MIIWMQSTSVLPGQIMKVRWVLLGVVSVSAVIVHALWGRSTCAEAQQKESAIPSAAVRREFVWQDFARLQRKCVLDISGADLAASKKEFGADPEDMKSQEIRLQRSITYTSKQGADPEALERFKKQAEEEMKAESQALFQARRQKLLQRGFELLDENTLIVNVGQVWR